MGLAVQGKSRIWESLWAITLVALLARLAAIGFLYRNTWNPARNFWLFGYEIGRIAQSVAEGNGNANPLDRQTGPTAWMTPAYPYLLAGIFKLFGVYTRASAFAILCLNGLFSALVCIPIFFVARGSFGRTVALGAAWTWALLPYAIYLSSSFVWETCFSALLLTILFLLTLRLKEQPSRWAWLGYGLLWGFAVLTNASVISVLPLLVGWALYHLRRNRQPWLAPAGLLVLAVAATLLPWEVRNYRTFHQLIPLRDNFWLEVWVGNDGRTEDWFSYAAHPSTSERELAEFERLGEIRYMAQKRSDALGFITDHPWTFVLTSLRRFLYTWTGFWSFKPRYLAVELYDPANIFFTVPLTLLMLIGLWQAFRRTREVALPYAYVLLFYPMVYYVTHPGIRYRHVIDPEIVILAVLGAICLVSQAREVTREGQALSP